MRRLLYAKNRLCLPLIFALASCPALAFEPADSGLADRIGKYADHYQKSTVHTADEARARLAARLAALDALLARSRPSYQLRWKQYLLWEQLAAELGADDPNVLRLQAISKRYYWGINGLSLTEFLAVRSALDDYIDCLLAVGRGAPREEFRRRIAALVELCGHDARRPTSDEIGEHVAWLMTTGQAPELSSWLQRKYSQPNLIVHLSRDLLSTALDPFQQEIDRTATMTRSVAGVAVTGSAHTKATVTARIVPSDRGAALRLQLRGTAASPLNSATQGPVSVYSSGECTLFATKEIFWTDAGVVAAPTQARCEAKSELTGVEINRFRVLRERSQGGFIDRFISNIAMNQASEKQLEAEQDASRQAESELTVELDQQVDRKLTDINAQVDQYYRIPLTRLGMLPSISTAVTSNAVRIDLVRPSYGELSSPDRPNYRPAPGTLSFSFHESALAGFLHRFARGATWSDRFLADLQRTIVGDNDYEMRLGPHPRWSVCLDWTRPVSARFSEQGVELEMRMRHVTIDDKPYPGAFAVRSRYTVHTTPTVPRFERVGDIELVWLDGDAKIPAEREMLTEFLTRKFRGFFLAECHTDGLAAPAGGQWGNLSVMRVVEVQMEPGWMTAVLRSDPSKE